MKKNKKREQELERERRREAFNKRLDQDMLDLNQFMLFLVDFLVFYFVLGSLVLFTGMAVNVPVWEEPCIAWSPLLFFFFEYVHATTVKELESNNQTPLDKDVTINGIIDLIKKIKSLFK